MSETLEETLAAHVRRLQAEGCTAGTIVQRRRWVLRAAAGGGDPRWWTRDDVVAHLSSNSAWSANTRSSYCRQARGWFRWLEETERIGRTPMATLRQPRVPRGVPHPVDTDLLQEALARATGDLRTWLLLAAYEGLRVAEIARFRGEQIRGGRLRVTGKGGVTAALPLHPLVAELADRYPQSGYWFPPGSRSSRCPHIRSETVTVLVRELFAPYGARVTPHSLRHWYGTEVLEASGGNLITAQHLLRHASVQTTQIYAQVRDANRDAAVLALPDLTVPGVTR